MSGLTDRLGWCRGLRPTGRWLVLIAGVALAWPWPREWCASAIVPSLSPLIAAASVLSARTATVLTLLGAAVLLLAVVFPRWFCRCGCPVGLLHEMVEHIRPGGRKSWLEVPAIGQWLALLTVGGAALGNPLFLWLDPLALFNGSLNAWRQPLAPASLVAGLGLPLLLLLNLVAPRLWCQRICPLGAAQVLLAGSWRRMWQRARGGKLNEPRPLSARLSSEEGEGVGRLDRRWFLSALGGAAGAFALKTFRAQDRPPLRPPGALEEARFTGVCVRCGNCARACPSRIIRPGFGDGGVAGFLAPRLRFDTDYCREDCHRCTKVCPSGAIARLSLAEKKRRVIGHAAVNLDLCLLAQGRECTACIQKCPYRAIALHSADGGLSNEPRVAQDRCNGCGACEAVCPAEPLRAIRVQPPPVRLGSARPPEI